MRKKPTWSDYMCEEGWIEYIEEGLITGPKAGKLIRAKLRERNEACHAAYQFCADRGANKKLLDNLAAINNGKTPPHRVWPLNDGKWKWKRCGHTAGTACAACLREAEAKRS